MPGANESFVFFRCAAQFGKRELALYSEASANLDERECISVETDQIEFAFGMLRHVVSSNEDTAEAPHSAAPQAFAPREWKRLCRKDRDAPSTARTQIRFAREPPSFVTS